MNHSSCTFKQKFLKTRTEAVKWANSILKDYHLSLKILSIVLKKDISYSFSHLNDELKKKEEKKFIEIVKKIKKGIPLAYILKKEYFFGLELNVKKNVFIPRPETEFLVQHILDLNLKKNSKILDIGTGSGAIAISLKKERKDLKVFASDISLSSLFQAKENAKKYNLKIKLICADLLNGVKGKFDLIASNPPYIPKNFIKNLPKNVKKEPIIALNGGTQGLEVIEKILTNAKDHLKKDGILVLEIGDGQFKKIQENSKKMGYNFKEVIFDFSNIERVISLKWSN